MVLIGAPFAPTLPFERMDAFGSFAPLGTTRAIVILEAPTTDPTAIGISTGDLASFTQAGQVFVPRGSDLKDGDRVTYQNRRYLLMGAPAWDMDHPMTGADFGWMIFALVVEPAQLVADVLALRGQSITLTPAVGVVTPKPGGGNDYAAAVPRQPQRFVLRNTNILDGSERAKTDGGMTRKFEFLLMGAADAAIELGDVWEDEVAKYVVESVDRTRPYQVTAAVTGFLKVTGHSSG